MQGTYTIRRNGETVAQVDNLLTTASSRALLRYLAGESQSWAGSIAVGASSDTPDVDDRHLGFELGRGVVNVRTSSPTDSAVVVKATISEEIEGQMHELGLYSSINGSEYGEDQLLITDFDPDNTTAVGVSLGAARIGRASSEIAVAASSSTKAEFRDMLFDISALGPEDRIILAYYASNVGAVQVRLRNSPNDFVYHEFTAQPGYNMHEWGISDFSTGGNGSLLNTFVGIEVIAAGLGSDGTLVLDGLRADDSDVFEEQVLVSRAVLPEPIEKAAGTDIEVEYSIRFGF